MGGRSTLAFLQRRHTDDQQSREKMHNITIYQRNANQNYNEVPPHTGLNGHHQKSTNNKCRRECGEKGILLCCWWECKLIQPLGRTARRFLKNQKQNYHMTKQSYSWAYQRENHNSKRYMHPNVHHSTIYNSQDMKAT